MGTMKVAVIAAEMEGRATGVGRYIEGLLTGLEKWQHGVEWHLFFQGDEVPKGVLPAGPFHAHLSHHGGSRVVWEQATVSKAIAEGGFDAVFGPAYTLPFWLRVPSVVTIHDLSFEVLPDEFDFRERWRRRLLARRAARVADRVLTVSDHMARMLERTYGLAQSRVAVVSHGIDRQRFSPTAEETDQEVLTELGIRRPYLLWAGSVLERRLPQSVLQAFSAVRERRPELELVIAGANRMRRPDRLQRWIRDLGLDGSVRQLGWVDEQFLAPLYRAAQFAIYVSRHEGFGLPPVECLACGTPVVVSHGLGLDDAWQAYPYRVAELETEAIAATMCTLVDDPAAAAAAVANAPATLAAFDWQQSSRLLVAELARVVAS